MLARRDYTKAQLRQKLQAKLYLAEHIEFVLQDLIQSGFINDVRYAENFIHYRLAKGYGAKRIAMELQTRGVEDEIIEAQLDAYEAEWLAAARRAWQKRFRGVKPTDFKSRMKQIHFLMQRGFERKHIEALFRIDEEIV